MELTICERWNMTVADPNESWFLEWALRSPKDAGIHLTAGLKCYEMAADLDIYSAVEYFGGIGAQSLMIQDLFRPEDHVVMDYSPEAARHLARLGGKWVSDWADSYEPRNYRTADLVGLDFGDLTVWKTREGEKHRELMNRVFDGEPQAVVLTDVACRYLHLHRERYETLLGAGTCATYPSYLDALADRLEALYGYVMVGGFYHRWSTVMTLVPDGPRGVFVPTPESPIGLQVNP